MLLHCYTFNPNYQIKGENSIPKIVSSLQENNPLIPTPYQRMEFLSEVYLKNIITFLTIKPLCPNEFISIEEPLEIIKRCKDYTTLILSSGIIVDNSILKRLKTFPTTYEYQRAPLMECLENDLSVQYVDVTRELEKIQILCSQYGLPFFQHSMPAIEYIKKLKK